MRDCLRESMKAAMNSMPDEESRWSLRVDAGWHRVNLLAGIAFVGKALEESQLRETPSPIPETKSVSWPDFYRQPPPSLAVWPN